MMDTDYFVLWPGETVHDHHDNFDSARDDLMEQLKCDWRAASQSNETFHLWDEYEAAYDEMRDWVDDDDDDGPTWSVEVDGESYLIERG